MTKKNRRYLRRAGGQTSPASQVIEPRIPQWDQHKFKIDHTLMFNWILDPSPENFQAIMTNWTEVNGNPLFSQIFQAEYEALWSEAERQLVGKEATQEDLTAIRNKLFLGCIQTTTGAMDLIANYDWSK